VEFH